MTNLPSVSSPLPRDLQQFIQRVREALDGGGEDAVVTARQLIAAGVVKNKNGGGFAPITGPIEAPRPPSNLSASGALASIIVSWNAPTYNGHAYTEIWAHTSNVIGDAVLVGMTAGNNFPHNLGASATRYYWVRNINQNGVASSFNATNGVQATTGTSPTYLLDLLTDEITSTQLATALGDRIDLIDGAAGVSGSVNARIATEATTTTNALALKADASTVTSLATTVGSNSTAITSEATARSNADTAIASDVTTLSTTVGGNTTSIQTNATSVNGLEAQYTVKIDNNGHVSGFGLGSEDIDGTLVSNFMVAADRFSVVNPNVVNGAITMSVGGSSSYKRYVKVPETVWNAYTYVNGDTLIITGMGEHPINGKNGTYTIFGKVNNISPGYGKVIEVGKVRQGGTYGPLPDDLGTVGFPAAYPDARGAINLDQKAPFIISTGSTTINGVTVPAGVYMNSAMIGDATISNAKIGSLTADKITASLLNTVDFYGNTIAGSTIYLGGSITYTQDSDGNNIGIQSVASPKITLDSNGATFLVAAFRVSNGTSNETPFEVSGGAVRIKTANIGDGTITDAKIGNTIQSAAYSAGSAGWKIDKTGAMEMNNATFRGTIDVQGSAGSNRLNITSTKIQVIDSSNVVRVKLGDLS